MNTTNIRSNSAFKLMLVLAALFIIIAGLKAAQSFLVPFVFALFFAALGGPAVQWLMNKKVPKFISVFLVAVTMLSLLIAIGVILARSANEFILSLPNYTNKFTGIVTELSTQLEAYGIHLAFNLTEGLEPQSFMNLIGTTIRTFVSTLSSMLMVIVILLFMLFEAADFKAKLYTAFGSSYNQDKFEQTALDVQRYLAIKTFTSGMTGIGVWLINTIWGIEFAVLWALLAFLMNYIPVIGSILAAVPALIVALVNLGFGNTVGLMIAYMVVNIGISNFIEPILMGRKLGLSPLVVFLSLVVWGWIWGPAGMLLSVPLTMIVRILLEHSGEFSWIAVLMDGQVNSKKKSPA